MTVKSKESVPMGLSPIFLLIYYTSVLVLTCSSITATEPFKDLMREAGVGSHLGSEDEIKNYWISVVNAGLTVSILGAVVVGPFADFAGAKITAVLGQVLLIIGYGLSFLSASDSGVMHYTGSIMLGLSFAAIFVSHTSVAALFPGNSTFALAVIGSGPDVGLAVPTILGSVANHLGIRATVIAYMIMAACVAVLECFLVPWKAFDPEPFVASSRSPQMQQSLMDTQILPNSDSYGSLEARGWVFIEDDLPSRTNTAAKMSDIHNITTTPPAPIYMTNRSLSKQIFSPTFIILTLFTGINMFRRIHYQQLVSFILNDIGSETGTDVDTISSYIMGFKLALPLAFVPAIAMGVFTNAFGIVWGITLENTWGVLLYLCSSFAVMRLQWLSILFYNLMSCYTFGIVFASLSTYFGWKTLGTLQGIQLCFAGLFAQLFLPWNAYVVNHFPNKRGSSFVLLILSMILYSIPLYLKKFERMCGAESKQLFSRRLPHALTL